MTESQPKKPWRLFKGRRSDREPTADERTKVAENEAKAWANDIESALRALANDEIFIENTREAILAGTETAPVIKYLREEDSVLDLTRKTFTIQVAPPQHNPLDYHVSKNPTLKNGELIAFPFELTSKGFCAKETVRGSRDADFIYIQKGAPLQKVLREMYHTSSDRIRYISGASLINEAQEVFNFTARYSDILHRVGQPQETQSQPRRGLRFLGGKK